jgi:hypothetical protein
VPNGHGGQQVSKVRSLHAVEQVDGMSSWRALTHLLAGWMPSRSASISQY